MNNTIDQLRYSSRKLVRELGMLQLNKMDGKEQPSYWHTLIEIDKEPGITISKLAQVLLISLPTLSRIVASLVKEELVTIIEGLDKRERFIEVTLKGKEKIKYIDEYSNAKIKRAFYFLSPDDRSQLIDSIGKYALALEQSRLLREQVKILKLTTSRTVRKQLIQMVEAIQRDEFKIPITPEINISILKAEDQYYYNNTCNFWYAVDGQGSLVGCIGLKKINETQGEVKKFFVTAEYRGLGIAQKLMGSLVKNALMHGFETLFLGTVNQLQAAHRFYERNGFKLINKNLLPEQYELCHLDTCFYQGETHQLAGLLINS